MKEEFNIGQIVFYTRILPKVGIYDLLEIKLRTVEDTYIVGCDEKDHTAYLISEIEAETCIFTSRKDALNKIKEEKKKGKENIWKEEN